LQCDEDEEDELSSRLAAAEAAAAAAATRSSSRSSSGAPSAMLGVQRAIDALSSGRAAGDGVEGDVEAAKLLPHPVSPEMRDILGFYCVLN
jgi:hypothetical protein